MSTTTPPPFADRLTARAELLHEALEDEQAAIITCEQQIARLQQELATRMARRSQLAGGLAEIRGLLQEYAPVPNPGLDEE